MWSCPKCQRSFQKTNQAHTCQLLDIASLFERRSTEMRLLYDLVDRFVTGLGVCRKEAVSPDVIFYKSKSTFLAIKVKKKWLDIQFFLDHAEHVHPVKKCLQTSKNRFVHIVSIDQKLELNSQLKNWISSSYQLINASQH